MENYCATDQALLELILNIRVRFLFKTITDPTQTAHAAGGQPPGFSKLSRSTQNKLTQRIESIIPVSGICSCKRSRITCVVTLLHILGALIGEAKNPGSQQYDTLSLCVLNPTSIDDKVQHLLDLDCHVLLLAKTSATKIVERDFSRYAKDQVTGCIGSCPAADKIMTLAEQRGRPSRRGKSVGTAVVSRLL